MSVGMNSGQPKKPIPPHCAECGASRPIAVLREGATPDAVGGLSSHQWLCGDCLYRRDHPDAERAIKLPRERTKKLQKETLF